MNRGIGLFFLTIAFVANAGEFVVSKTSALTAKEKLGRQLFFDTNLSSPAGQACGSCHDPKTFFIDPDKNQPTSDGALPHLKGSRNTPMALYTAFSPPFHYDNKEGLYIGGQFLDGRAATLAEQAKGPFLNPLEMANPNKSTVVNKVRKASYAKLFTQVYGINAFNNANTAYNKIADAIAAFERTSIFQPFSSKYDYFLAGKTSFTAQEMRGKKLFEEDDKGNCAACHPSRPSEDGTPPLFTDFSYDNLGVPPNPNNPFYQLPGRLNPEGRKFVDKGLGNFVHEPAENGKFKVPTLRNIAKTEPYMHNGYFKTLEAVVDFYSHRDIKPLCKKMWVTEADALKQACWPKPEIAQNVNIDELGELNLNAEEIKDIVAFLKTLTDGYKANK
ncbi:cytochrome-c peroxidase [Crenothrix sp.]|uniref:cytochrome-c peroxidase n=1 Tax=Crenothrix sp. TaxID=3100433 RepID=UPI00374D3BB3